MTLLESAAGDTLVGERISVTGVVQGVGFRPFVARLAHDLGVHGNVRNTSTAVHIDVVAPPPVVDEFVRRLVVDAPPLARITTVDRRPADPDGSHVVGDGFVIVESDAEAGAKSLVPPDAAVCADCLHELRDPTDRRFGHPFITCTNCGPRFTIIRDLPYDRPTTTMVGFEMCPTCRSEYDDPLDRRHHAQPIGCHDCGPRLTWIDGTDGPDRTDGPDVFVDRAVAALAAGSIVAVKGLGGFQLLCRADRTDVVDRLRDRKARPDKPFAVMTPDVAAAERIATVTDIEAAELTSPAAPIVLLVARPDSPVCESVAPADPLVGVMLPSTPLHHLLLDRWGDTVGAVPLVVTSANASGAPICHRDDELDEVVLPLADAVLTHDRPIHVACDDSVVREVAGEIVPVRRARGYAPMPVSITAADRTAPSDTAADRTSPGDVPTVLAVGGELKNTVALAVGGRAHVSQHLGDLANLATLSAFEQQVSDLGRFHEVEPEVVVADLHPDYLGTRWAQRHHADRLRLVQHHHAHVAAVMAEHGLDPHRPIVGVAFDGTGFGPDGTVWGGEFLLADSSGFERLAHLDTFLLPGGEAAVREPWRTAMSLLHHAGVDDVDDLPPCAVAPQQRSLLARQLDREIACATTSSMGRLFDGVASLLGIRHRISFEAHAAIELEIAASCATGVGPVAIAAMTVDDDGVISFDHTVRSLVDGLRRGVPVEALADAFHLVVAGAVAEVAERSLPRAADRVIALSGGVFQNARLVVECRRRLADLDARVLTHRVVPPNDGGLCVGQAWIGTHAVHDPSTEPRVPTPERGH